MTLIEKLRAGVPMHSEPGGEWAVSSANKTMQEAADELERLEAVAAEYDALMRHLKAGGEFSEFLKSRIRH